ncbi:ACT domain-containing protein [Azospirillum sp.]|uniref:ACT domain-containing protein n=1 Tax=Azospirillum sp. TaxID=34012 RepID=UPI002D66621A|nr:ACT domain-containing protein [Azospirillum sp.]HYD64885.1 ACT domain-containing protein [Azospirillum sp.]
MPPTLAERLRKGDRRTVGSAPGVAESVLMDPAQIPELVDCLFDEHAGVRMRAADALERVSRTHDLTPYAERLLTEGAAIEQAEVRWHLAQILPRLALTEPQRWHAASLMGAWFRRAESRIVRTSALQGMVDLAEQNALLRDMAADMIRAALRSGIPSLAARARRILKPVQVDAAMLEAVMLPPEPDPLGLTLLPDALAVARPEAGEGVPAWVDWTDPLVSVTRTAEELSVVCPEHRVPDDVRAERGWRAFKVDGPLDFALTGILAGLAAPLAEAGISIFALSTFDTDYLLVRSADVERAVTILEKTCRIRRA